MLPPGFVRCFASLSFLALADEFLSPRKVIEARLLFADGAVSLLACLLARGRTDQMLSICLVGLS